MITHGKAPQVGLPALRSECYRAVHPCPLDVLGTESEAGRWGCDGDRRRRLVPSPEPRAISELRALGDVSRIVRGEAGTWVRAPGRS